jgi:hypothetical protein
VILSILSSAHGTRQIETEADEIQAVLRAAKGIGQRRA